MGPAMADVALLSVVSSGVVGVLGGATGIYGQRVSLRNETSKRLEARRDDLRTILSDAAAVAMGANPPSGQRDLDLRELAAALDTVASEMELQRARLGVRVGPRSSVFLAYRELELEIINLEAVIWEAPSGLTVHGIRNPDVGLDENERAAAEAIATAYRAIYKCLGRFFDASQQLIGWTS
jgi:hypothetical protein